MTTPLEQFLESERREFENLHLGESGKWKIDRKIAEHWLSAHDQRLLAKILEMVEETIHNHTFKVSSVGTSVLGLKEKLLSLLTTTKV